MIPAHDRVRAAPSPGVQAELDEQRLAAVAAYVGASPERITARIEELDAEWDAERVLATNASSLTLLGGVRTRGEIDAERTALKALRGDFYHVATDPSEPSASARHALDAAIHR